MFDLRGEADFSEGSSEFVLEATGSIKAVAAEIVATKKQKAARRIHLFWLLFCEAKK